MRKIIFSREDVETILKLYNDKVSMDKIGEIYNVSRRVITRLLKENDINLKSASDYNRKYNIDENFFDIIDTEGKAYFLGFLYADGYNNIKKRTINLRITDKEILVKLNKLVSNDDMIWEQPRGKIGKQIYVLAFSSKQMSESLDRLGCGKNKTFGCVFPDNQIVPTDLMHHFMRGYFDGDGYITHSLAKRKNNRFSHSVGFGITGNSTFIDSYVDKLSHDCGISKAKLIHNNREGRDSRCASFIYSGRNQITTIFEYLYNDATLYMKRKYDKFIYIINREDLAVVV